MGIEEGDGGTPKEFSLSPEEVEDLRRVALEPMSLVDIVRTEYDPPVSPSDLEVELSEGSAIAVTNDDGNIIRIVRYAGEEAEQKRAAEELEVREVAVARVFRRLDGQLLPDPDSYARELQVDSETSTSRIFWTPDNEEFEKTGMWTSRMIVDGAASKTCMKMDPDQDLSEGAVVSLSTDGSKGCQESIEEALERIRGIYPETA